MKILEGKTVQEEYGNLYKELQKTLASEKDLEKFGYVLGCLLNGAIQEKTGTTISSRDWGGRMLFEGMKISLDETNKAFFER